MPSNVPRRAQSEPLPSGGPRHAVTAPASAGSPTAGTAAGESVLHQRLQGAFLAIIGLAGLVGGVMFSIEAPRFTPVPVVFLTFWLVMVVVGQILFTGLDKLRSAGVGAPSPSQVRAAAAVAAIVVAVGMMGFAATSVGTGTAVAAPCPGGGPPTCGPDPGGPTLTFTQPPGQTITPGGGQPGLPGGQQGGIATSPTRGGGGNSQGIQAQTPQFGTPGQQAPNIPGNEPPGQPGQGGQQPQGTQAQQNPARTTVPGGPQQTEGQPTSSGQQPTQSTVTVTQSQSQCPAPGAGGNGGAGGPGNGEPGNDGGITGGPDSGGNDGLPSWAYLVAEATGVLAGRRRNSGGAPISSGSTPTNGADDSPSPGNAAGDQAAVAEPATPTADTGATTTTDDQGEAPTSDQQSSDGGTITRELPEDDSTNVLHAGYDSTGMYIPSRGEYGPFTPAQQEAQQQVPDLSNPFPADSVQDLVMPLIEEGTKPPFDDPTAAVLNQAGGPQISQGDGYPLTNPGKPIGVSDITTPAASVASGFEAQLQQSAKDAARRAATPGIFSPEPARDAALRAEEAALGRSARRAVPIPRIGGGVLTAAGAAYDVSTGSRTVPDALGNTAAATLGGIAGAALLAPIPGGAFVGGMLGSYAGGLIWDNKGAIVNGWRKLFG